MTSYESTGHLLLTPVDREAPARAVRLRELGLGERTDGELDGWARQVAETLDVPSAGVNFVGEERQFFAGLHHAATAPQSAYPARVLARDHGYCPHVVVRGRALALEDVCDFARFAGNAVVDGSGVRSYLGAPLTDRHGTVLGTLCAVDVVPRRWGTEGLATVKALAAELSDLLGAREDRPR
ncbi:GAF domain-containing protein [Streptomyces sp. NPDC091027]|uniref:GAF domain-containing protein n=1 Tax=Streptomyces sp. NPDC091027 TaxID=3365971 RepID=UPI0038277D51